jgi:hypothetical protein
MMLFQHTATRKLKILAYNLYQSIYNDDCYSLSDLKWLEVIENELLSRGYAINEFKKRIRFIKV